jgi:hypothetical protein
VNVLLNFDFTEETAAPCIKPLRCDAQRMLSKIGCSDGFVPWAPSDSKRRLVLSIASPPTEVRELTDVQNRTINGKLASIVQRSSSMSLRLSASSAGTSSTVYTNVLVAQSIVQGAFFTSTSHWSTRIIQLTKTTSTLRPWIASMVSLGRATSRWVVVAAIVNNEQIQTQISPESTAASRRPRSETEQALT